MSQPAADAVLDPGIVDQAILWYVQSLSGMQTARERSAFEQWLGAHPDHALAWGQLQSMGGELRGSTAHIAAPLSRATLSRLGKHGRGRRDALKVVAGLGVGGGSLWLGHGLLQQQGMLADYRSATGERRDIRLADGTLLQLNTGSAVDVRFDAHSRLIQLHSGEIQVTTAADPAGRPLMVACRDGLLVPRGTRFTVRQEADATLLAVSEGAVEIRPLGGQAMRLVPAGEQSRFGRDGIAPNQPLDEATQAWTEGMLTAERRRLDDFIAELNRYHTGRLRCAPEVAELRVTGAWPLQGEQPAEAILASLERSLPIRIDRFTRYWVTVQPGKR